MLHQRGVGWPRRMGGIGKERLERIPHARGRGGVLTQRRPAPRRGAPAAPLAQPAPRRRALLVQCSQNEKGDGDGAQPRRERGCWRHRRVSQGAGTGGVEGRGAAGRLPRVKPGVDQSQNASRQRRGGAGKAKGGEGKQGGLQLQLGKSECRGVARAAVTAAPDSGGQGARGLEGARAPAQALLPETTRPSEAVPAGMLMTGPMAAAVCSEAGSPGREGEGGGEAARSRPSRWADARAAGRWDHAALWHFSLVTAPLLHPAPPRATTTPTCQRLVAGHDAFDAGRQLQAAHVRRQPGGQLRPGGGQRRSRQRRRRGGRHRGGGRHGGGRRHCGGGSAALLSRAQPPAELH